MRKLMVILAAGVTLSSAGSTLGQAASGRPTVPAGDWRLIGGSQEEGGSITFIESSSIRRDGQTASFEVVTIYRRLQRQGRGSSPYDGEKEKVRLDCGSKRSFTTGLARYRGNGEAMPVVVAQPLGGYDPPPAGTVEDLELRTACGEIPLLTEKVPDPYAWARTRWAAKR